MDCYCFCHSSLRDLSRGGARLEKGRVRLTSARVPRDDDPAFASLLIHSRVPVVLCTPPSLPLEPSMSLPPPHPPSLHTHSPALLRLAINNILDSERASPSASPHDWHDNVVVSHPPSPTALRATFSDDPSDVEPLATSCRPLSDITPLDPESLERVPLSTPPRTPEPLLLRGKEAREVEEGEDPERRYPLIVVTGGSGFIGSHTVLEILQEGIYGVVVLDNLENSRIEVLHRVRILAAQHHSSLGLVQSLHPPLYFHSVDVQDRPALAAVFALYAATPTTSRIVSGIHFAARKSVSGSLKDPLSYYQINVGGTMNLAEVLDRWGVKKMVFSSSCVVYGAEASGEGILEEQLDVRQGASKGITNPYGRTKRMCEEILSDLSTADPEWFTMSLRYTNPSGAHPSGYIGEDPTNAANLMPIVTQVLQGKRDVVRVYGADYPTPDGTGVRDFIHVVDLAKAHLAAIRQMAAGNPLSRNSTYNLGTNKGTSVLTVIETLSLIAQRPIKIVICPRRPGDLGCVVCCADKAKAELGWSAERGIVEMCRDLVNWQALNPNGYSKVDEVLAEG